MIMPIEHVECSVNMLICGTYPTRTARTGKGGNI